MANEITLEGKIIQILLIEYKSEIRTILLPLPIKK